MNGVTLSDEEYDYYVDRDLILTALEENGLVDWDKYAEVVTEYYRKKG